ncbi:hypothetical protein WJX73_006313 [Symbiochloris irregularis]|uniref:Uncharacterized protein n=1 Tax=Symbiochloris irregularis TaxID=706552 RepID=A0AAW1NMX4_9CHLO
MRLQQRHQRADPPDPEGEPLRDPRPAILDQEVEQSDSFKEPGTDYFEGGQWEWLGWSSNILLPFLMACALTAGLAARGNWLTANYPLPRSSPQELQGQQQSPAQDFIPGV